MRTASLKLSFIIVLMLTVGMIIEIKSYHTHSMNCSFISLSYPAISPIRYDIDLTIKPFIRRLSGEVEITFDINESITKYYRNHFNKSLHELSLHARGLKPDIPYTLLTKINPSNTTTYGLARFKYCRDDILILIFQENLESGPYILYLKYSSTSNASEDLFYPYIKSRDNIKWLFTNIYTINPILALFPYWEDPSFNQSESIYNISIKYPIYHQVFSNLLPWITLSDEFGTEKTYFESFTSSQTSSLSIALVDDIMINVNYQDIHHMWHDVKKNFEYVHQMAHVTFSNLIKQLKLDVKYDLRRINHIIIPNSPMRSMGRHRLVIYREKDITYNKNSDFMGRSIEVEKLMAYEVARQLFVGIIGKKNKKADQWTNELLSSFYSYYIVDQMRKGERLMELFTVQVMQQALDINIAANNTRISIHEARDGSEMDSLLYSLLYHKKAFALFRMLLNILTPETFHKAVQKYVQAASNEQTEDLWSIMEKMCPQKTHGGFTIGEIMNSWLTEAYHSVLKIHTERKPAIYFKYFYDRRKIPLTYVLSRNLSSYNISNVDWITYIRVKEIEEIPEQQFLLVNLEQLGYYRVNYQHHNWLMIISHLRMNNFTNIPAVTRAQLINDAYYFTATGELGRQLFLDLIKYLKNDTDYIAWYPLFKIMSYMSSFFKFEESNVLKVALFKRGRTDINNNPRSGRPRTATTPEMSDYVHDLVLEDRRLTVVDLAEVTGVSIGSVHEILTNELGIKLTLWIRLVTMDETWVYHYDSELRQQTAEWTEPSCSAPKQPKWSKSSRKIHFREILNSLVDKVGFEPQPSDDGMRTSLILLARRWACKLGNLKCANAATNRLKVYMNNNELDRIPSIEKDWIFCSGLMRANRSVWNDLWRTGMKTNNMEILEYLSCSENLYTIIDYLKLTISPSTFGTSRPFMGQICRTIVKKHIGKEPVLFYVIRNYNEIVNRHPEFYDGSLLSDMIMNVYKIDQLDMINDFAYNKFSWKLSTPSAAPFNTLIKRRKMYLNETEEKFKFLSKNWEFFN